MAQSALRLINRFAEFIPVDRIDEMPKALRGIYVLYNYRPKIKMYDVVYVGMTAAGKRGGIRGRLNKHRKKKIGLWTHCSIFEVWDNISKEEVKELEGLFRHIYRRDSRANKLNKQKGFGKLKSIKDQKIVAW